MARVLRVVMYHYVRDFQRTRFPRIRGMDVDGFRRQVDALRADHEMASLESSLAFLAGSYQPKRNLCLLTFDDGLKEHYSNVLPILSERGIPGAFFLITQCIQERKLADAHKNHVLMATMDFAEYRQAFMTTLSSLFPRTDPSIDTAVARAKYRWDDPDAACFKYLLNFKLSPSERGKVLDALFARSIGNEHDVADEFYMTWDEAREMQTAGMALGGHSHEHNPLGSLSDEAQEADLSSCAALLRREIPAQRTWPFSYPFGNEGSFNQVTIHHLRALGFACGFATEIGSNDVGRDPFRIRRIDPKDLPSA